jgi:nucleoside-diphosphate-sugar epimerase
MIAILGATGYIGRSLARKMAVDEQGPLALFARNPASLANETWPAHVSHHSLTDFHAGSFELVINAIGAGDPGRVVSMGAEIFEVTQAWDQRVMSTIGPRTRYVFLSSGAVYGSAFERPVGADSVLSLPVNQLGTVAPYTLCKLYAEARHRYLAERPILDVRVFGYADPSISRSGSFFLAQLACSIATRQPLVTTPHDMVRDYASVCELHALIRCWLNSGAPNRSVDLYTKAPVSKLKLLEIAASRYDLKIAYSENAIGSPTGAKPVYASAFHAAAEFGYVPARDSTEVVLDTLDAIAAT